MHSADYQRLPQESDSQNALLNEYVEPLRPPTYYGDGPFDPPSSEEEDEELLLKRTPRTPGYAERGGSNHFADSEVGIFSVCAWYSQ